MDKHCVYGQCDYFLAIGSRFIARALTQTTLTNKKVHYFVLKGPLFTINGPLCTTKVHFFTIKRPLLVHFVSKKSTIRKIKVHFLKWSTSIYTKDPTYTYIPKSIYLFPLFYGLFTSFYRLSQGKY